MAKRANSLGVRLGRQQIALMLYISERASKAEYAELVSGRTVHYTDLDGQPYEMYVTAKDVFVAKSLVSKGYATVCTVDKEHRFKLTEEGTDLLLAVRARKQPYESGT